MGQGHNHESVGICLVGVLDDDRQPDDNFTVLQMRMLKFLVTGCQVLWPDVLIKGHDHLNGNKECPCFNIDQWLCEEGMTGENAA